MLELHGEVTKFWTYRTAFVPGVVILNLTDYDRMEIKNLLNEHGYDLSNHICWQMDDGTYCMYSDLRLYVAGSIIEGNW